MQQVWGTAIHTPSVSSDYLDPQITGGPVPMAWARGEEVDWMALPFCPDRQIDTGFGAGAM